MVDRSRSLFLRGLAVALCTLILFLIIGLPQPPQTEAEEVPTLADQDFERLSLELSEEPGYFDTDFPRPVRDDPERDAEVSNRIACGRWGQPDDLAGLVVFLASNASSYMHGSIVAIDGGWLAR